MRPITYRTYWVPTGEMREFEGYPTGVAGLVVSRCPGMDGFTIVHARSGALIAQEFDSPEAALAAVRDLAPLADWTLTGIEMQEYARRPSFALDVIGVVERFGGWISGTRPQDAEHLAIDNGVIA